MSEANQKSKQVKGERSLKIQPRYNITTRKVYPEIKLGGLWLQQLGFETGARVTIITEPNRLVIQTV